MKIQQPKSQRRNSRQDVYSPIPVHNEIELFHNLTRSPQPSRKSSISEPKEGGKQEPEQVSEEKEIPLNNNWRSKETNENKEENQNWKDKELIPTETVNKWSTKEPQVRSQESNWLQKDQNDNWPTVSKEEDRKNDSKVSDHGKLRRKESYNSFKIFHSFENKDNENGQDLHETLHFSNLHGEVSIINVINFCHVNLKQGTL